MSSTEALDAVAIGPWGVAVSLVLVVVAVIVSWRRELGLERSLVEATGRALVQLVAVGYGLRLLLADGTPLAWSVGWVAFMVGFAAWTITKRADQVDGLLGLAVVAMAVTATATLGVVFGLGIFPFEPRYLVPTAGMMVGNAMNAAVLAARRTVDDVTDNRAQIEARVALGQPWQQASRRVLQRSLRDALTPQVETTRAVGLVFLPGAMTGLILAGADPLDAVLVQAAVMFLILGGVAISTLVMQAGLARRLFTDDDRLAPLVRS
jgi:putative ABC transport system permease protein